MSMSIAYKILKKELEEFDGRIAHGFALSAEEQQWHERLKIILKIV